MRRSSPSPPRRTSLPSPPVVGQTSLGSRSGRCPTTAAVDQLTLADKHRMTGNRRELPMGHALIGIAVLVRRACAPLEPGGAQRHSPGRARSSQRRGPRLAASSSGATSDSWLPAVATCQATIRRRVRDCSSFTSAYVGRAPSVPAPRRRFRVDQVGEEPRPVVRGAQRRLHGESAFERTRQFSKSPAMSSGSLGAASSG